MGDVDVKKVHGVLAGGDGGGPRHPPPSALPGLVLAAVLGLGACGGGAGSVSDTAGRATREATSGWATLGSPTATPATAVVVSPRPSVLAGTVQPAVQAAAPSATAGSHPSLARVALTVPTIT